jgi:alpha-mannosidase
VSLFNRTVGATLFSDGLTEYESADGAIAVTLLRSVGELSRNDLPERPGNAGWPASTPDAQCIGEFEAAFALMLHGPRSAATIDEIEQAADDVLLPLVGETLRSALRVPEAREGITLQGAGLACSTIKESEDGESIVLRCVNLTDNEVRGAWKLPRALREAELARLDESPTGPVSVLDDTVRFIAAPRAVVTILAR